MKTSVTTVRTNLPITAEEKARREKLVLDNLDLPKIVFRQMAESQLAFREKDDLISEGNLALCLAANRWEPGRASFRTYASSCILRKMLAYLKKEFAYHNVFISLSELLEAEEGGED